MEKLLYYRTRVMDLDAPDIVEMCDDLLAAAGYAERVSYEYQLFRWLGWFFQEQPPAKLNARHFLPGSSLVTRVSKLAGTPLHAFCTELARERHFGLELHADVNLLTLLKAVYRKDKLPTTIRR